MAKDELPHHADGLVHVTVTEDDERGFPAQLQRNLLQVAERAAEDPQIKRISKQL